MTFLDPSNRVPDSIVYKRLIGFDIGCLDIVFIMKLVKNSIIVKNSQGSVCVIPHDVEDLWHLYNLIRPGDKITCSTFRKVIKSSTTIISSQRVRITLTIKVSNIDFDPNDSNIRLAGINVVENNYVKLGAHHTLDVFPNHKITIEKDAWDSIDLDRLDIACNPAKQATVAAIVMQKGLANICLISGYMTIVKARVEKSIPKKRGLVKAHDDAMLRFFELVLQAMLREIDFNIIKVVIVASPGYVKDDFFKFVFRETERRPELRVLRDNKDQFVLVHSSSGHKYALEQVLADESLQNRLSDTYAAKAAAALKDFFLLINEDSEKAFYGYDHVRMAQDMGAIESLLISDSLFRSSDVSTRKIYTTLVEDCRESGASVHIFSSLHTSGEQLDQLTGVAALLRYGLPDLNDLQMSVNASNNHTDETRSAKLSHLSDNEQVIESVFDSDTEQSPRTTRDMADVQAAVEDLFGS